MRTESIHNTCRTVMGEYFVLFLDGGEISPASLPPCTRKEEAVSWNQQLMYVRSYNHVSTTAERATSPTKLDICDLVQGVCIPYCSRRSCQAHLVGVYSLYQPRTSPALHCAGRPPGCVTEREKAIKHGRITRRCATTPDLSTDIVLNLGHTASPINIRNASGPGHDPLMCVGYARGDW